MPVPGSLSSMTTAPCLAAWLGFLLSPAAVGFIPAGGVSLLGCWVILLPLFHTVSPPSLSELCPDLPRLVEQLVHQHLCAEGASPTRCQTRSVWVCVVPIQDRKEQNEEHERTGSWWCFRCCRMENELRSPCLSPAPCGLLP